MRTIVHLSDIHFGRVDPRLVAPLVRTVHEIAPDLVAISGDLTQRARRRQFEQARAFLDQLPAPRLVVPGNHDVPLFNVAARFLNPYAGYRRYIAEDLEPVFEDGEMIAVGLNSARSLPLHGGGRLNETQVARAAARLRAAPPGAMRIVVTHHPFDLPAGHRLDGLIGRSGMAMPQLAAAGADLFLAGHLHVSHVGHTAQRYHTPGHSALVVQAGTLSTRGRGEVNAINVVRLAPPRITIERYSWNETAQAFQPTWTGDFQRTADGWR
ncbi:MAG TPA: metallophosphoesterase family protein [Vicinamibacterales bacterium]|nr:metallophosphoesterase family protein [Vicinamibacterales bacterium]